MTFKASGNSQPVPHVIPKLQKDMGEISTMEDPQPGEVMCNLPLRPQGQPWVLVRNPSLITSPVSTVVLHALTHFILGTTLKFWSSPSGTLEKWTTAKLTLWSGSNLLVERATKIDKQSLWEGKAFGTVTAPCCPQSLGDSSYRGVCYHEAPG